MTTTERKGAFIPRQERRDEIRAQRNAALQRHRDQLKAQREWKEHHQADFLAQKRYQEEMAKRKGLDPIADLDTSEQA